MMTPDYLVPAQQFHNLFIRNTPFLDVRAEDEFIKGSIPQSTNLPILNNNERCLVGTCYKKKGQQAAIKLGHDLVNGTLKAERIRSWCEVAANNPDIHLYCWRGGMRSNLAHQWINAEGINLPLIEGGYRALRRSLIEVIDQVANNIPMIRIGGKTGVAKTPLINQIHNSVDLEARANHRGSSFGRKINHQPTQSNFEHMLAIDLLRITHINPNTNILFVEDEGRNIGSLSIPLTFLNAMQHSPLALVEMPLEFRVQRVIQEYVIDMLAAFETQYADYGFEHFSNYLNESLLRIQKRLGLERYRETAHLLAHALQTQQNTNNTQEHATWITVLLTQYYDPMYEYQIKKNKVSIIFRGNYADTLDWAQQYTDQYTTQ